MKNKVCHKVEQRLRYNLKIWNKKGVFDVLKDISSNVTLVKLMDTLVNMNYAMSIIRSWIFSSNYKMHFV